MSIADEWSGLADLLANLIEKYASNLGLDDMPVPTTQVEEKRLKHCNLSTIPKKGAQNQAPLKAG